MRSVSRFFLLLSLLLSSFLAPEALALKEKKTAVNLLPDPLELPYERPIGFSVNLGGILSGTFEGRFHLGLVRNLTLVVAPSFQKTPELPIYHLVNKRTLPIDFMRLHLGAGVRGHFYAYDSFDGWFIEGLGRGGMAWIGTDKYSWSVIPSLMVGYAVVYDSGYTASFGLGAEYEFLMAGDSPGPNTEWLKTAYYGITKLPLMGEISIGWTW